MLNEQDIRNAIIQIMKSKFDWLANQEFISIDTNLRNDLGFDSIAIVSLQVSLEDEFDFRFDPLSIDFSQVFKSVKTLTDYILILKQN